MSKIYDFAVLGGGLTGASLGWALAKLGLSVAVLDGDDIGYRASRGNFALVWLQSKGLNMPAYVNWTRKSVEAWRGFADDLQKDTGIDIALEQDGGYHVALSEVELEKLISTGQRINAQPGVHKYEFEILDGDEVRRRLPGAGPSIVGATYSRYDGHVNALRFFRALHEALLSTGAHFMPRHGVERIERDGCFRLHTKGEQPLVKADRIVLAAGLDNARLAPMVGLEAPVRPQPGNILVTEKTRRFLHAPVQTVRQTDEGSIMIGDSQEETGYAENVNLGIASVMADRAVKMFPAIADLNIVRMWACLRVIGPDGFPIYDQSETHPGAFLATCHSGVTLAAAHARLLAPAIASGGLPEDVGAFTARRFHVS